MLAMPYLLRKTQNEAQCHKHRTYHANQGECVRVPYLLCEIKEKRRWMSPSTAYATRYEGGCRQVPHLPRGTKVDIDKSQVCHAKLDDIDDKFFLYYFIFFLNYFKLCSLLFSFNIYNLIQIPSHTSY